MKNIINVVVIPMPRISFFLKGVGYVLIGIIVGLLNQIAVSHFFENGKDMLDSPLRFLFPSGGIFFCELVSWCMLLVLILYLTKEVTKYRKTVLLAIVISLSIVFYPNNLLVEFIDSLFSFVPTYKHVLSSDLLFIYLIGNAASIEILFISAVITILLLFIVIGAFASIFFQKS